MYLAKFTGLLIVQIYEKFRPFVHFQVNDKFLFHRAGNFNEGPNIHQILAQRIWPDTFRLDPTTLRKPIGPVTREKSWEACLGPPVEQRVRGERASAACKFYNQFFFLPS